MYVLRPPQKRKPHNHSNTSANREQMLANEVVPPVLL